jgi:allantoate deiminase
VINAGKYDGPLGILAALSVVENIIAQKISLPFHIEVIAFSEEEGVRFHTTYLGSKVVAGSFNHDLLETKDENDHTIQDVLTDLKFDSVAIPKDAIPPEDWLGYYEIHIEQGPVLYDRNVPAGVVSSIAGQKRIEIEFIGEAGHAGTVPMNMRRDALCAAAQFILEVETYVTRERRSIVATVGKLNVVNGASNVIPGKVACTLDIRSSDAELLSDAYEKINKICEEICYKRHTYFEWNLVQESEPILCDENLKNLLSQSVRNKHIELIDLASGAGHDAVIISAVAPIIMLFVKCFKGISHNPLENVEIEDIAAALEISDDFIRELGKHQQAKR